MSHNSERMMGLMEDMMKSTEQGMKLRFDLQHLVESFMDEAEHERDVAVKTAMVRWLGKIMDVLQEDMEVVKRNGK